jgi:hypothetical protein
MERSTCRLARLSQISPHIPSKWLSRIKLPQKRPHRPDFVPNVHKAIGPDGRVEQRRDGKQIPSHCQRRPTGTTGVDPIDKVLYVSAEDDVVAGGGEIPESASSRIPGALVVDPHVRKIVQEGGMRVSENALWLLVVATKAHSQSILKNVIMMKEGLEKGQLVTPEIELPTAASPSKRRPSPQKKATSPSFAALKGPRAKKVVRASDICTLTATMQGGPIDSLGGSLSRSTFERCLHSSYASNYVSPGQDFLEVQRFISSEILAGAARRAKREREQPKLAAVPHQAKPDIAPTDQPSQMEEKPTAPPSVAASQSLAMSQAKVHGLGRGAKNLAALKARAASPPLTQAPNDAETLDASVPNDDGVRDESLDGNADGRASSEGDGNADGETDGGSPLNIHGRRGKGFGIKNLAAMRARTTKKD